MNHPVTISIPSIEDVVIRSSSHFTRSLLTCDPVLISRMEQNNYLSFIAGVGREAQDNFQDPDQIIRVRKCAQALLNHIQNSKITITNTDHNFLELLVELNSGNCFDTICFYIRNYETKYRKYR